MRTTQVTKQIQHMSFVFLSLPPPPPSCRFLFYGNTKDKRSLDTRTQVPEPPAAFKTEKYEYQEKGQRK